MSEVRLVPCCTSIKHQQFTCYKTCWICFDCLCDGFQLSIKIRVPTSWIGFVSDYFLTSVLIVCRSFQWTSRDLVEAQPHLLTGLLPGLSPWQRTCSYIGAPEVSLSEQIPLKLFLPEIFNWSLMATSLVFRYLHHLYPCERLHPGICVLLGPRDKRKNPGRNPMVLQMMFCFISSLHSNC